MSCAAGCRPSSDPMLLWLWCRQAAAAQIQPLAWEPLYAVGAALRRQKTKKKKKGSEVQRVLGCVQAHFSQWLWGTGAGTAGECQWLLWGDPPSWGWGEGSRHPLVVTTCQTCGPTGLGPWLARWLLSHPSSSLPLVLVQGFFWHFLRAVFGQRKDFSEVLWFLSPKSSLSFQMQFINLILWIDAANFNNHF